MNEWLHIPQSYKTGASPDVGLCHAQNTFLKIQPAYHIYPTPPLGQDMTQGQFLSGV